MNMQRPQDFLEFNKYVLNKTYYLSEHKGKNVSESYVLSCNRRNRLLIILAAWISYTQK